MASQTTEQRVLAIRAKLSKKLKRPPSSGEILAEMPEHEQVSPARVRAIIAGAGLRTYKVPPNRAPIDKPIKPGRSQFELLVVANIRRLYRAELSKPKPRSDLQMALDMGFSDPVSAAGNFRRYFNGGTEIGGLAVMRFATVFGVQIYELFLPEQAERAIGVAGNRV